MVHEENIGFELELRGRISRLEQQLETVISNQAKILRELAALRPPSEIADRVSQNALLGSGPRSPIMDDQPVAAFIRDRLLQSATINAVLREVTATFGADRAPSRAAIGRYRMRLLAEPGKRSQPQRTLVTAKGAD